MRRRSFMASLPAAAAPAFSWQDLARTSGPLKISALEILRVEGRRETVTGGGSQHQVQPLHIYDEHRPRPFHEASSGRRTTVKTSALYLKIKTGAGLEGIYGPIDREAAIVVDQQLRPFLAGKDPLAGETLWDQMHRLSRHSRAGHFMMAISAADNALWDLRGRYFNAPVYRLLGGPTRPVVEAYASCLGYSVEPELAAKRALELQAEGYRYQKWFLAYGPGDGPQGQRKNIELVRALREAVGDETQLMFDAFMGWNLNYALEWAQLAEPYRPFWIEEAFQPDKIDSFAALRRSTYIPVASGEHIYARWDAHRYLKAEALNYLQTDPEWCGGVSELARICALASLYDVQVVPHGHALHTPLHVVASQPPNTCPLVEYLIRKMDSYHHFEKRPPRVARGRIALPEGAGFGIELDPAKVESSAVVRWD